MPDFDGTSAEMEAKLRTLPRGHVVEIATSDNSPYARKARAELDRRDGRRYAITQTVAGISMVLSLIAILVTVGF